MGLFSVSASDSAPSQVQADPSWARTPKGHFFRLSHLEPDQLGLVGLGGVYVVWHKGVKPEWVYVGQSDDLSVALTRALDDEDVYDYEPRGGLWCTWATIRPEYRDGAVAYLRRLLNPVIEPRPGDELDPESVELIAIQPPG